MILQKNTEMNASIQTLEAPMGECVLLLPKVIQEKIPLIVYLHPATGNAQTMIPEAELAVKQGFAALVFT